MKNAFGRECQSKVPYTVLGLRDYGRVDLRVAARGEIFVLEVNPNPWLSSDCEFFMAWHKKGRSHDDLVGRVVELALERAAVNGR